MLYLLAITPVYVLFSYFVAEFVGSNRMIGWWWTFFFSLTLTPFMGLMIALCNPRIGPLMPLSAFFQTLIIVLSFGSSIIALVLVVLALEAEQGLIFYCLAALGFAGGFIYGIKQVIFWPKEME